MRSVATLAFAVRGRVLLKYLAQLALPMAGMTGGAALVALLAREWAHAGRYGVLTAGLLAFALTAGRLRVTSRVQTNEAMAVTALTFVLGAAVMVWPFMAHGLPFGDAVFEAVSAITTTGLSSLASVEGHSPVFLFARAWMQWYGGFVIVVLALALILEPGSVSRRVYEVEGGAEDLVGNTRTRARRILQLYAGLTLAGFVAVWLSGVGAFEALLHVFTAISTAGFSTRDASLAGLGGWWPAALLTLISVAGALSFALYFHAWRDWRVVLRDPGLHMLAVAGAVTIALLALFLHGAGMPWGQVLGHAPVMALSAQTTTGFASMPVADMPDAALLTLVFSMFIGADLGSTGGGIKVLRLLVMLKLAHEVVVRTCLPPHTVRSPRLGGRRLPERDIVTALTVVILFITVVLASWLAFLWLGEPPLEALFEVVSATATAGLSAGVARPELHPALKLILCADMLLGRLEVVAMFVLLYPRTWFGRKDSPL